MVRYILQRLALAVVSVWAICTITFFIAVTAPGDPAALAAGQHGDPATLARVRHDLGLDKPPMARYLLFLDGAVHGDLGQSYVTHERVTAWLARGIGPSATLAGLAILVALLVGVPLGILAAVKANSWIDRTLMASLLVGVSVPNFVLAPLLILVFAVKLGWLPVEGWDDWHNAVLPVIVLAARPSALIGRMTRSSMLEILGQDYIRTARAKGLSPASVIFKHALKNAFLPVLTSAGVSFGYLLSGSFVVETVFGVPGVGYASINSLTTSDYPLIEGATILIATIFVTVNLIVDLLYATLDPRIRVGDTSAS
ncbi:MAG: ABC transporter permease [Capsulimonadaceae bacterium]